MAQEEKEKEKVKMKEKGLLKRFFGKRKKIETSKPNKSEEKSSSGSCADPETKSCIETREEQDQASSTSSANTGVESTAAFILSKYFTYCVCDR